MFSGVTSTNSSSDINSIDCSSDIVTGGTSFNASSLPEARVCVIRFSLHTLTVKSSLLEFFAHLTEYAVN